MSCSLLMHVTHNTLVTTEKLATANVSQQTGFTHTVGHRPIYETKNYTTPRASMPNVKINLVNMYGNSMPRYSTPMQRRQNLSLQTKGDGRILFPAIGLIGQFIL